MSLLAKYGAYTGKDLMTREIPPPSFIVDGLIPEGLSYIIAAPKIGKSWMVLDLALAVTQGTPFLGVIPVEKRPVLYMALEDNDGRMQARARNLGIESLPDSIAFVHTVPPNEVHEMIAEFMTLYRFEKPLVIVDTLGKVMMGKSPNSSAFQHDYEMSSRFLKTAKEHGGSVVIVHHNRKASSDDFLEDASGTQGITAAADGVLVIRRDRGEADGDLYVTGRDVNDGAYSVTFNDGKWTLVGSNLPEAGRAHGQQSITAGLAPLQAAIARLAYDSMPNPIGGEIVAEKLWDMLPGDDSDSKRKRALDEMRRLKDAATPRLKQAGRGFYTSVENVEIAEKESSPEVTAPAVIQQQLDNAEIALEGLQW